MPFRSRLISMFLFASAVMAAHRKHQAEIRTETTNYLGGDILTVNNDTFHAVRSSFKVPNVAGELGTGIVIWIGIGGSTCNGADGFRGGVTAIIGSNGPSYSAWTGAFPGPDSTLLVDNLNVVSAGDTIEVTVHADAFGSPSFVMVVNRNNGGIRLQQYTTPVIAACAQTAEWILQPLSAGGDTFKPIANFGRVVFNGPVAFGSSNVYTSADGFAHNVEQDGKFYTFTAINSSSIVIDYL